MRYSIMLQIVVGTTVVLVGAAALFAWIQNRSTERSFLESTQWNQAAS
ncbi:hypothetical protein [Leptolyngbya ohadii]|nr:hypothetical protein [Leptolyngbya ohadii]